MKILYFINGFDRGGAELGLVQLVREGFFADCDLAIASIVRGRGDIAETLQQLGVRPSILVDRERMRVRDLLVAGWRLHRMLRNENPDLLILSLPQANILGRVVGTLAGVPTIVSFEHNARLAKRVYERLYRLLAGSIGVVFVDCEATWREVAERFYGAETREHFVVPLVSFPDPPMREERVAAEPCRIVSVGRLSPQKAQHVVIEAVSVLRRAGFMVELDIAGEGEREAELRDLAASLGVSDLVRFIGFVPKWWERTRYDAFVLTSVHEGLCIAALEAMWAGIPVIAPPVGGIKDYGTPDNMVLLDECRPDSVAVAVKRVVEDDALARKITRNAQAAISRAYGATAVRESYARLNATLRSRSAV